MIQSWALLRSATKTDPERKRMRRGVVVAVLVLAIATSGLGQDNASTEVSAERQEIELLKQKIAELDQRLRIAERKNEFKAEDDATKAKAGVTLDAVAAKENALENKVKGFGPFSFSGDLRLRHESFFGSGPVNGTEPATRNRERYRLRFNRSEERRVGKECRSRWSP